MSNESGGCGTCNQSYLPPHTHTHLPLSHLESYCSVRMAVLPPMVLNRAASVLMKSIWTPAYRFPSAEGGSVCGNGGVKVEALEIWNINWTTEKARKPTDQNCNVLLLGIVGTFSFPGIHKTRDQPEQVILQRASLRKNKLVTTSPGTEGKSSTRPVSQFVGLKYSEGQECPGLLPRDPGCRSLCEGSVSPPPSSLC